jgi:hypothetical protein
MPTFVQKPPGFRVILLEHHLIRDLMPVPPSARKQREINSNKERFMHLSGPSITPACWDSESTIKSTNEASEPHRLHQGREHNKSAKN